VEKLTGIEQGKREGGREEEREEEIEWEEGRKGRRKGRRERRDAPSNSSFSARMVLTRECKTSMKVPT
jgi:hypothetical protein